MNAVSTAYYQPLVGAQSEQVVNPAKQKIGETTGEAPDNASNWAREYYESVNKARIDLDLSQYAKINEKQVQTNYEATNILSSRIDTAEDYETFIDAVFSSRRHDEFYYGEKSPFQNTGISARAHNDFRKSDIFETAAYYEESIKILDIARAKYGGDVWKAPYNKDMITALAEQVAYYNKTSAEYIRPLEDNAQRLKTYIERDDFSNRSDKAQKLLIAQYDMPTSILTDAYKILGAGSALNIAA